MTLPDPKSGPVILTPSDHRPAAVDWAPEDQHAPVEPEPVPLDLRDWWDMARGALVCGLLIGGALAGVGVFLREVW